MTRVFGLFRLWIELTGTAGHIPDSSERIPGTKSYTRYKLIDQFRRVLIGCDKTDHCILWIEPS